MAIPITQPPQVTIQNTQTQVVTKPKITRTSIFYVNDIHSNLKNLERIKTASDQFDTFVPSEKTDKLKLAGGDIGVGRDANFNKIAVTFENSIKMMASAGGNHEFDLNKTDLVKALEKAKYKFMGINVEIPQDTELNKKLSQDITKSYIQEVNGEKYGIIGLMPFDFKNHLSDPDEYKDLNILPIEKTIPIIQKEIDNLKEKGVNKVIVLSHIGYSEDVQLAKSVEGIDVIIGGHTHDLITGIQEGKNLFYSKQTGAPTIITQAGKNGDYFGVLNLEFNENGVITQAQNNVTESDTFPKSAMMEYTVDKILGEPTVIGTIKSVPKHKHSLITENPTLNFLADAERSELGTDIVMLNSGNIRANMEEGKLTDRDLKIITPFDNKLWIVKMNEKELVDAVKVGAKSLTTVDHMPGLLQFSGIEYTISKSGEVKAMTFVDSKGKRTNIDVNNPNPFKTYTVTIDDYIGKGGNGYVKNKESEVLTKFNFDKNKLVIDYLKKLNAPVEISDEKRIKIVD